MKKWRFGVEPVPIEQAIAFIAAIAYPADDESRAKKRVRERIRYATKKKKIDASISMDAGAWEWALGRRDWQKLVAVPGFPYKQLAQVTGIARLQAGGSGYGVGTPSDSDVLMAEFHKAHSRISELLIENATIKELEDQLRAAQSAINAYKLVDAEKSNTAAKSGRKGKGCPKNRNP